MLNLSPDSHCAPLKYDFTLARLANSVMQTLLKEVVLNTRIVLLGKHPADNFLEKETKKTPDNRTGYLQS